MMRWVWGIVLVGHLVLGIVMSIVFLTSILRTLWRFEDYMIAAAIAMVWLVYFLAMIGNRSGEKTLLELAIDARKAEMRRRIRESEEAS